MFAVTVLSTSYHRVQYFEWSGTGPQANVFDASIYFDSLIKGLSRFWHVKFRIDPGQAFFILQKLSPLLNVVAGGQWSVLRKAPLRCPAGSSVRCTPAIDSVSRRIRRTAVTRRFSKVLLGWQRLRRKSDLGEFPDICFENGRSWYGIVRSWFMFTASFSKEVFSSYFLNQNCDSHAGAMQACCMCINVEIKTLTLLIHGMIAMVFLQFCPVLHIGRIVCRIPRTGNLNSPRNHPESYFEQTNRFQRREVPFSISFVIGNWGGQEISSVMIEWSNWWLTAATRIVFRESWLVGSSGIKHF